MEIDPVLQNLVRLAREGKIEGRIWVAVPGGIISGKLTQWPAFKSVVTLSWAYDQIAHYLKKENQAGVNSPIKSIELLDVQITSGGAEKRQTWARIDMSEVSAWGIESH